MKFREALPPSCPPNAAQNIALSDVWRFIKSNTVQSDSFDSHAKRSLKKREGVSDCDHASCSLFIGNKTTERMLKLQKWRNFAARVELNIPAGSGLSISDGTHVHFWAFDSFSFSTAIVRVVER